MEHPFQARHTRVAEYIRMSTDQQDLSVSVQRSAILEYAHAHGMRVVESFEDQGRSGLTLHQRQGMKRLLSVVSLDHCEFSAVLVYDVSRWGRFQDTDASAYYEYHCRLHGVDVIYVKESFGTDGSAVGSIIKSIKRVMAAEYSRELGIKVRAGQDRAIQLGFQMGAIPMLGLRRAAMSKDRTRLRLLDRFERKSLQSDRIVWVHGPDTEVEAVRRIFELYVSTHLSIRQVTRQAESEGIRNRLGAPLTLENVRKILHSDCYAGNFVWGACRYPLRRRRAESDPRLVRQRGVIEPIISEDTWLRTQAKLLSCTRHPRNRALLLQDLRAALAAKPDLNQVEFRAFGCMNPLIYVREFGSVKRAVELAGGDPNYSETRRRQHQRRAYELTGLLLKDIVVALRNAQVVSSIQPKHRSLEIGGVTVKLHLLWQMNSPDGPAWFFSRCRTSCEYVLFARMLDASSAHDFVLTDRAHCRVFPRWCSRTVAGYQTLCSEIQLVEALSELPNRLR